MTFMESYYKDDFNVMKAKDKCFKHLDLIDERIRDADAKDYKRLYHLYRLRSKELARLALCYQKIALEAKSSFIKANYHGVLKAYYECFGSE